jgi:hypothetical protein
MLKLLRRVLGEHIALETRFASELPGVHADRGMMEQLLTNLAINARDAMPDGGQLVVALDTVEVDADRAARAIGGAPRPPRRADRLRHRRRHPRRAPAAHLRAVLHDQAGRQGHRPRPRDGVRHRDLAPRPGSRPIAQTWRWCSRAATAPRAPPTSCRPGPRSCPSRSIAPGWRRRCAARSTRAPRVPRDCDRTLSRGAPALISAAAPPRSA